MFLQPVRKRTRATVTDQIGDQFIGFTAKLRTVVVDSELNAQHFTRQRRNVMDDNALLRISDDRNGNFRLFDILVGHSPKGLCSNLCQFRQRLIAVDNRFHQIGGVILAVKIAQRLLHRITRFVA
ncbi:hypothetical protein SDC9_201449 [bioreactor metagenome]|uniref:Uncharacterized protein n=1 Tax=bioreactor metagenome TaxID=1076179 RepID=A0A645J2V1_9ZZZZ